MKRKGKKPPPAGVLTSAQAAELLGCSKALVNKLARTGELPSWQVGNHNRFHKTAVEAYRNRERATT